MKIGVFTVLLSNEDLSDALDYLVKCGVEAVEIATGGFMPTAHANPEVLLSNREALNVFKDTITSRGLEISALSCHGNPLHPQTEIAVAHQKAFRNTVELAGKLGITRVVTFSGCPGDHDGAKYPNWVTCRWPGDFVKILEYQWEQKLIPYWQKEAQFAAEHGVTQICLEMHPGFCVYNPETLLRLRSAVGDAIGANYDPSHLFWQGIDPVASIRRLGDSIYHFHAKDCRIDALNTRVNGVLDTKPYEEIVHRSWIFRTVGYGHSYEVWRDIISNLIMVGYDDVLSIEHEDGLMSINEGLEKAIAFLKQVANKESPPDSIWWS